MAAFMIATKAIKNSGIRLAGDILMTMVVGEIGMGRWMNSAARDSSAKGMAAAMQ